VVVDPILNDWNGMALEVAQWAELGRFIETGSFQDGRVYVVEN